MEKKSLADTAKFMNENGYKINRATEGGGSKPRLGHFTVSNLRSILTSKKYLGIRIFQDGDQLKETKAVWPAIVDELTFSRAQSILDKGKKRKPHSKNRYPYLLTPLVFCHECGERMVGKSAWGNGGKTSYYEHSSSQKRESCLMKKSKRCEPYRVPAKVLEPKVWEIIEKLMRKKGFSEELMRKAKQHEEKKSEHHELRRFQEKARLIENRISILTERLSELPTSVSASPIYRQMEKLEKEQTKAQEQIQKLEAKATDSPIPAMDYQKILKGFRKLANGSKEDQAKVIQSLIHRIVIKRQGFAAQLYCGKDFFAAEGSTSLTSGGPTGT